jgi:hypothetical protein
VTKLCNGIYKFQINERASGMHGFFYTQYLIGSEIVCFLVSCAKQKMWEKAIEDP